MSQANSVSDLERAEHSSAVLAKRVTNVNTSGTQINPATEETLQTIPDKIPTYDMYITRNGDGTIATKIWKIAGTSTVVKTLTYNRSGGYLVSKIIT